MYDLVRVHVPARQNTRGVTQAMGSQAVDALCVPIHNRLYLREHIIAGRKPKVAHRAVVVAQ